MIKKSYTYMAIPPGEAIKEHLEYYNMTQKELAQRMGVSERYISNLVNGEATLPYEVACSLETIFEVPSYYWLNFEKEYREELIKVKEENEMDEDKEIAKKYPYNELKNLGWIEENKKDSEKVFALRRFFQVAKLVYLKDNLMPKLAFRTTKTIETSRYAVMATVQKVRIEAAKIQTQKIDIRKLKKFLPELRKMTNLDPCEVFEELQEKLKEFGIALVVLPHLKGSFFHGVTFYLGKKIAMGVTLHKEYADVFWFSLLHEIAHVVLGDINQDTEITQEDEDKSDKFAQDILIPFEEYSKFVSKKDFTKQSIIDFANSLNIAPFVVVGRLQNDKIIEFNKFNDLKTKYNIKKLIDKK